MISLVLLLCSALQSQTFDFGRDREPVASLDSLWRFHPGDDLRWASPDFDDSSWKLLRSDRPWSEQGHPGMSGFAWYRFSLRIPPNSGPLSLLFSPINTDYEVYVDGQRVRAAHSKLPETFLIWAPRHDEEVPLVQTSSPGQPKSSVVAIRVWHSPIWSPYTGGGPTAPGNLVGSSKLVAARAASRQLAVESQFADHFLLAVTSVIVGLTVLGLFWLRPKEPEYLWFGVMLISNALADISSLFGRAVALLPLTISLQINYVLFALFLVAALYFFSLVLGARRGPIWWGAFVFAVLVPCINPFYFAGLISAFAINLLSQFFVLPAYLWILVILINRALRRNTDAQILLLPTLLLFGYAVLDTVTVALWQAGSTPLSVVEVIDESRFHLVTFDLSLSVILDLVFLWALLGFLIRRFTLARQQEERLASDIEAARQVQQILLPEELSAVPGFQIESVYLPAESVGGDFFQHIPDGHGGVLIIAGDVAGKGLQAAMLVSVIVGAIRTVADYTNDPAAILCALNEHMLGRTRGGFTTCLAAHISANGRLRLANAGHLPPYLNGAPLEVQGSLPLGIASDVTYDLQEFSLSPGDSLRFVSDGVVEAQDASGNLLGFDRTRQLSHQKAQQIAKAAQDFGQKDDITVVAVEFLGAAQVVS